MSDDTAPPLESVLTRTLMTLQPRPSHRPFLSEAFFRLPAAASVHRDADMHAGLHSSDDHIAVVAHHTVYRESSGVEATAQYTWDTPRPITLGAPSSSSPDVICSNSAPNGGGATSISFACPRAARCSAAPWRAAAASHFRLSTHRPACPSKRSLCQNGFKKKAAPEKLK